MSLLTSLLQPLPLFTLATLLRVVLLLYGLWQDANTPLKYTDIDYLVFTDAARFLSTEGPYARETYRYTPILSWFLLPTAWHPLLFSFGKVLFSLADLLAGWFLVKILEMRGVRGARNGGYAAIWLWNPMVATISTRGSSEGLLGLLTAGLLWAVVKKRTFLAAVILGVAVHFKIYPFVYAAGVFWWMDRETMEGVEEKKDQTLVEKIIGFLTFDRMLLAIVSFATFMGLNLAMYLIYGHPFILHTYLYHVTRLDHRHNFSPYNMVLYQISPLIVSPKFSVPSLAFLPQLLLSAILIPLRTAKVNLPTCLLAQTFAFVAFNKVCTSQYFLWYLIFLPVTLPDSTFMEKPRVGLAALVAWVISQAAWLHQGFLLEFMGESTFFPGMWLASLAFFGVNCWILGIMIDDARSRPWSVVGLTKKTN